MTTDRLIHRQFACFAAVGVVATALQYGFVLSAVCNYWLNYHLTFRSRRPHLAAASRFALVATGGLALNAGMMTLLVDSLRWPYLLAQIATTVPVVSCNFFANRMWSFADAGAPRKTLAEERT
jgi:putative flippase GtrA